MADTEMESTRDVRRGGANRFSRSRNNSTKKLSSGLDGVGGFVSLVKSKKERVRKLSSVGRASSSQEEMGCEVSDREGDFGSTSVCTSKRFKVPLKIFDDCNGVDHASVPRKLRSAMKKRGHESISPPSPDSKRPNHTNDGVESSKTGDDSKKPKLNVVSHPISEWSPRQRLYGPITKDEEEVVETLFALAGMFPNNAATDKSKLGESSEAIPSVSPDVKGGLKPTFEGSVVSGEELGSSRKADKVEPWIKVERLSEKTVKMNSLNNPSVQGLFKLPDSKQFCLETYSSVPPMNPQAQPQEQETTLPERSPPVLSMSLANQPEQHLIKEGKKNGLALWPGLSSEGTGSPGPIPRSSASNIPAWLKSAQSASTRPLFEIDASSSQDKASEHTCCKNPWKRCAAHVHISRLIEGLQTPARAQQPNNLKSSEGPKQEMVGSSFVKNTNEVRGVLQHKNIYQDHRHVQSLDLFSLSSGVEANNGTQLYHKGPEPMSQFQVPSLNPLAHHRLQLPSQSRYYPDRLPSATQQGQLRRYVGTPFSSPVNPSSSSVQHQRQQSYQQRLWAAQAQYGPAAATALVQNWQNGIPTGIQCAQATSTPSPQVLGASRYILQQQQQFFICQD